MPYFVNSQNLNIYYEEFGPRDAEKTVFFLNGSGQDCKGNRPLASALSDKYHCILMDYRGYGKSEPSCYNSMRWCATDAKECIEYLDIDKVTFFGHSMGVSVALGYAKEFGDLHVDRMILVDQSPYVTSDGDWKHGRLQGEQDKEMILEFLKQIFDDPGKFMLSEMPRMGANYYKDKCDYPDALLNNDLFDFSWVPKGDGKVRYFDPEEIVAKSMVPKCDPLAYVATWFDSGIQDYRQVLPTMKFPVLYFAPYPGTEYDVPSNEYYRDHLGGPVEFVKLYPGTHMAIFEHWKESIIKIREFMEKEF